MSFFIPLQHQSTGKMVKRWTVGQSHFPVVRRVPRVRPGKHPNLFKIMYKNNEKVWNNNTHLSVNLKTQLRSDRRMKTGKGYPGVLQLDEESVVDEYLCRDPHFTFTEIVPQPTPKRNPHVYDGDYITVTRRADGSYHPNFKPMKVSEGFSVARYASNVANELLWALEGLVGKE